jgi:hypothetical protein
MDLLRLNRRAFLAAGSCSLAALAGRRISAGEPVPVVNPRATSGDRVAEPKWDEMLTITVGPKDADLIGKTDRVIQAAVDYVAKLGGGTVQLAPGKYLLRNAVTLRSQVRIVGAGAETILLKNASTKTKLAADSDWYDQEITLANPAGFQIGDGVCIQTKNHSGGIEVIKRTLVARSGKRFKLDRALRDNTWVAAETTVSNLFPLLTGEENSADVAIENLVLDGNRKENENLNGNYAGCIFLQDCNRYTIRGVEARSFNGDGISWQICHDVVVENCHSHDHAGLGVHPGSGSQRTVIRQNRLEQNDLGLFFCWGVKFGLAEENTIVDNRSYGISIGHNDTDNVVRNNEIRNSGKVGILFRNEANGQDFWPHRNRIEGNRIIDSGGDSGIGIDIQGKTRDLVITKNDIRETRQAMQRVGLRIGADATEIKLDDNRFAGYAKDVVDLRMS